MQNNSQRGQSFMIVLMIMTIALLIGVSASSRFISGIRNLTEADNASKALAVAEAGVERMLLIPSATLEGYVTNNNCGTTCQVTITDKTGQALTANIVLSLIGNTVTSYPLSVSEEESASVVLNGYPSGRNIYVCWNGTTSLTGYYIYTQSSQTKATPFAYNAVLTSNTLNGFSSTAANFGYANCFSVVTSDAPVALRLHSVYGRTDVSILPEAGYNIPIQGIQIVSTGKAGDATKKVTVIKSTAFAPTYFDYALYQKTPDQTLSN